jgi:hypothetical protein
VAHVAPKPMVKTALSHVAPELKQEAAAASRIACRQADEPGCKRDTSAAPATPAAPSSTCSGGIQPSGSLAMVPSIAPGASFSFLLDVVGMLAR